MKKEKFPRLVVQGKFKNYAGELRLIEKSKECFVVERSGIEYDSLQKPTERWNVVADISYGVNPNKVMPDYVQLWLLGILSENL
jgi:hypothetical protein